MGKFNRKEETAAEEGTKELTSKVNALTHTQRQWKNRDACSAGGGGNPGVPGSRGEQSPRPRTRPVGPRRLHGVPGGPEARPGRTELRDRLRSDRQSAASTPALTNALWSQGRR